jgi:hypothetical protein
LKLFALGRLEDERYFQVESHVSGCDVCKANVASITGDAFAAPLQAAQSLSDTPRPLACDGTMVEPAGLNPVTGGTNTSS